LISAYRPFDQTGGEKEIACSGKDHAHYTVFEDTGANSRASRVYCGETNQLQARTAKHDGAKDVVEAKKNETDMQQISRTKQTARK
jgi:hypothetical protein